MTGSDIFRTGLIGFAQNFAPFNLSVTKNAGAGGQSALIGIDEGLNDLISKCLPDIQKFDWEVELFSKVSHVPSLIVFSPGLQVETLDSKPLSLQEDRSDSAVNTAAES
jgi:hypothetical protein